MKRKEAITLSDRLFYSFLSLSGC